MKNKMIVIIFFLPIIIFSILLVGLYVTDPLQLLRTHSTKKGFVSNARHQMLRIINQYSFDSIILGTSMLENTSANESSKILGGKFMNLSLSGSDFNTRSIILNYALKKKKIKKVIYSLDNTGLFGIKIDDTDNFDFLYDDCKLNDIKVYFSSKYLICSIFNSYCLSSKDIDRPFAWYEDKEHKQRFGGLDNWFKAKNNQQVKNAFKSILSSIKKIESGKKNIDINFKENVLISEKYIDNTIIKYVSKYPDTEFILILPPYSRVKYAIDVQSNASSFEKYKSSIKYLVNKSSIYPNLKIYGWGNNAFLDDIANYKDLNHYEYKINSWMLGAIKREEGLLATDNIDNYLELFTKKALNFNLLEFGKKIDKYLNSNKNCN